MFIKSIVLDGFKSYGQRTEIKGFDEQFNAITGLNGSGKSNILDAICFVLGISNLSQVRAGSLQDLIYKSGQAGVNKATVSITFDNKNPSQCPPGYENFQEVTITRQIVMGGKNKYLINGTNVPNKKVQDLFCSVQLNVNNPHFLIMQGRVTKVLNMKPLEILAMIEEAAGTRMYELKRQAAQKTIDKKDAKLLEFQTIFIEEIAPKLEKLREERTEYLEYQRVTREVEHMVGLYEVWQYIQSIHAASNAEKEFEFGQKRIKNIEIEIENNIRAIQKLDNEMRELLKNAKSDDNIKLQEAEFELKEKEKMEAKANASIKTIKDNINTEQKKKTQLEKNLLDDKKALDIKELELSEVKLLFENLKENDAKDTEAFILSQRKFEAISAGMEVNEDGEAETLQEQLMHAKEEAAKACTESKQALMQLSFCKSQLNEKQRELGSNCSSYEADTINLNRKEQEVHLLKANINRLNFSEEHYNKVLEKKCSLLQDIRQLQEKVENFVTRKPYTKFIYSNPEPHFNQHSVKGVVCQLIKCEDSSFSVALETAAGGRLFNVVVDTEVTSKKLLQKGNLQLRTTFIPLNKIRANKMDNKIIRLAQELVGADNCKPALSLLKYDKEVQNAMEYIFGNIFICKDMNVAKIVTFHDGIRRKCVTLDGDVTDPSGTLSGGAPQKGGSILLQLSDIQQYEEQLVIKGKQLSKIETDIEQLSIIQEQYNSMKQKLDLACHELNLIKQRLHQTTHHRQQQEIDNLKLKIGELENKVKSCNELEMKCNQKACELEMKMKDGKRYREKQLKEAEQEMKTLKQKADKSRKDWKQREQDYDTLNLEISELKMGVENTKQLIQTTEEILTNLNEQFEKMSADINSIKETVSNLHCNVRQMKSIIAEKNKEVQKKNDMKDKLVAQNNELQLKIKELTHEMKKLEDNFKHAKSKEQELSKQIASDNIYLKDVERMSHKEGLDLERRLKLAQEKKNKLGRTVNTKAQSMFEHEEKQFTELRKKQTIVENDKKKIIATIVDLDQKKKNSLKLAYEQVSKDFGSILTTLLPGASAKLVAPPGKSILEGLEVKVSLGGVWKESLTELSGGQRSLAALSLILAMLLFKPAPLYILDEVDAALDLCHTQNIGNMLKSHFKKSQFIIVSLKDGMFNNANVLFRTKFIDGVSSVSRTVNKS